MTDLTEPSTSPSLHDENNGALTSDPVQQGAAPETPHTPGENATQKAPNETRSPKVKRSWKKFTIKWGILLIVALVSLFYSFRWVGSTTYRGTVQRVYETGAEYRVEFTELNGTVRVVGNADIEFPYFKVNTADVHAELNHLSTTHDIVDLKVWGLRQAWFSMFPNVVNVTFVRSNSDRLRARASLIANDIIKLLTEKSILKGGEELLPELIQSVELGLKAPDIEPEVKKSDMKTKR